MADYFTVYNQQDWKQKKTTTIHELETAHDYTTEYYLDQTVERLSAKIISKMTHHESNCSLFFMF